MDDLTKKRTRCCDVVPQKSTENKPGEQPGEHHYKCPKCGQDPVLIKIVG